MCQEEEIKVHEINKLTLIFVMKKHLMSMRIRYPHESTQYNADFLCDDDDDDCLWHWCHSNQLIWVPQSSSIWNGNVQSLNLYSIKQEMLTLKKFTFQLIDGLGIVDMQVLRFLLFIIHEMCVYTQFSLYFSTCCFIVVGEQMQSKQKSVLQEWGEWKEVERVECRGYAGNMYKNQEAK